MYHRLERLNCPPLEKLNQLARDTIAFGLEQELLMPDNGIKTAFVQYLAAKGFSKASEWLWGHDVTIRPHVLQLVRRPLTEKLGILSALDADMDLDACFATGYFHSPTIPPTSNAALNGEVKAIFRAFYKNILTVSEGVPGDKIGEPINLTRQIVLQAYLDAQRKIGLKVCPGCDGQPPSVADGVIHEDLDHFFPKSKYPLLTVHPLNLTPFCKHCNQSYKNDKDALYDKDQMVSTVTSLNEIYHPYLRHSREEIKIQVKQDPTGHAIVVLETLHPSPTNEARLNSLRYTLNIDARWTGDIQEERVQVRLENFLLDSSQGDPTSDIDSAWLNERLRDARKSFARGSGKIVGNTFAEAYTAFILDDAAANAKWLSWMQQSRPVALAVRA